MKSSESFTDTFSVSTHQFKTTGLPVTSDSRLWILGSRYIFPRLHVFLNLKRKYLKNFSVISRLCFKLITYYLLELNWESNPYQSSRLCKFLNHSVAFVPPLYGLSDYKSQHPLSAFFMTIFQSFAKKITTLHSSLERLEYPRGV